MSPESFRILSFSCYLGFFFTFCISVYFWYEKQISKWIVIGGAILSLLFLTSMFVFLQVFWMKELSWDMSDWGAYAACLGVPFTFASVLLAYRAFRKQSETARHTTFDTLFSQMLANHHNLYQKAVGNENSNIFHEMCVSFRDCSHKDPMSPKEIFEFWNAYREKIGADFANFDNYFKYIFYEVDWVCRQEIFNDEEKKRYVRMIQSQMNNEELFCYVVNLLAYYYLDQVRRGVKDFNDPIKITGHYKYLESLRNHSFFNDLYLSPLWISYFDKIDDESKKLLLTGGYMRDVSEFRDNEKKAGVLNI